MSHRLDGLPLTELYSNSKGVLLSVWHWLRFPFLWLLLLASCPYGFSREETLSRWVFHEFAVALFLAVVWWKLVTDVSWWKLVRILPFIVDAPASVLQSDSRPAEVNWIVSELETIILGVAV